MITITGKNDVMLFNGEVKRGHNNAISQQI